MTMTKLNTQLKAWTKEEFGVVRRMFDGLDINKSESSIESFLNMFFSTLGMKDSYIVARLECGEFSELDYYISSNNFNRLTARLISAYTLILNCNRYGTFRYNNTLSYAFIHGKKVIALTYKSVVDIVALFVLDFMDRSKEEFIQLFDNKDAAKSFYDFVMINLKKNNIKDIKEEKEEMRDIGRVDNLKNRELVYACNSCMHKDVCKMCDELKELTDKLIGVKSDVFTVKVSCNYFHSKSLERRCI